MFWWTFICEDTLWCFFIKSLHLISVHFWTYLRISPKYEGRIIPDFWEDFLLHMVLLKQHFVRAVTPRHHYGPGWISHTWCHMWVDQVCYHCWFSPSLSSTKTNHLFQYFQRKSKGHGFVSCKTVKCSSPCITKFNIYLIFILYYQ